MPETSQAGRQVAFTGEGSGEDHPDSPNSREDFEPVPLKEAEPNFFCKGRMELFEKWVTYPGVEPRSRFILDARRTHGERFWKGYWQA